MTASGKSHTYRTTVTWTGNRGTGTSGYRDYGREHEIAAGTKPTIAGSADPAFRGDAARWNPEDMLVASLSACHKLWYLHLCADAGIIVTAYVDEAVGTMVEDAAKGGTFTAVALNPVVTIAKGDPEKAAALHTVAHAKCFIANSVNFPVTCTPRIVAA